MKFRNVSQTNLGLLVVVASIIFLASCSKPLQVTVSPADIALDVAGTETVTATVTRKGNPQANVTVAFASGDTAVATVSPASAMTNTAGVAQATVTGSAAGNTTVTATADGASDSADVTVSDGTQPLAKRISSSSREVFLELSFARFHHFSVTYRLREAKRRRSCPCRVSASCAMAGV